MSNRREWLAQTGRLVAASALTRGAAFDVGHMRADTVRDDFPFASQCTYLTNAYVHPMSLSTRKAVQAFSEGRTYGSPATHTPDVPVPVAGVKALFASIIGARESDIALVPSTMVGENLIVRGLDIPRSGGNVVTEELTRPGFRHVSCGTAHVILQDSPMMRNDELGLADYGLEYIQPEIVCHAPFLDGSYLTQYHDIERTIEQFAKFSKKDAAAYRRMIAEYDAIKPLFDAASYTPVGFGKPINERLNEHTDGRKWLRPARLFAGMGTPALELVHTEGRLRRVHRNSGAPDRGSRRRGADQQNGRAADR